MKKIFLLLFIITFGMPAFAGWQTGGYLDDGSRFVLGFRGGVSLANAKIKNDIGNLQGYYYFSPTTGEVISAMAWAAAGEPTDYLFAGYGDLSTLPAKKDFSQVAFAAGASMGFVIPNNPQWRAEVGYDHIAETNYNQIPLFEGDLNVSGGDAGNAVVNVSSSGAMATISTDVISAMAYYDFFRGKAKSENTIIPYIGVGMGYASSKTSLKLSDIYGDLSTDSDLQNYGTADGDGVLQFETPTDKSKNPTSANIAVLGAVGLSYGVSKYTYLDLGARVMYIPKITWELVNADASHRREWFSAKDMIYTNIMLGLRFEF